MAHSDAAGWDVRVIGTDINSQELAAAAEGRYGPRAVSLLSDEDLQRFFVRDGGSWKVGPELRRLVEFHRHNPGHPAPAGATSSCAATS